MLIPAGIDGELPKSGIRINGNRSGSVFFGRKHFSGD